MTEVARIALRPRNIDPGVPVPLVSKRRGRFKDFERS
jgi:hypothetical protein